VVEGSGGSDVAWVVIYENANDATFDAAASAQDSSPATSFQDCMALTVLVTPLESSSRMPSPFTFTAFLNTR
jgi:hypothetical protein